MKDERELPGGPAAETLLEMGNIGTGSSMASLSHIIGEKVCYACLLYTSPSPRDCS